MSVMKKTQISILKMKMRTLYRERSRILDSMDCGIFLARHFSSGLRDVERRLDATLDALSKLDPACPTTRFLA